MKKGTKIFVASTFLLGLLFVFILLGCNRVDQEALKNFPLESYTAKILQFKEIDFSKVLIYGTESEDHEKDNLLLYFVKGTAVLRFRGLDKLSKNYSKSTNETMVLNYNMDNETTLPVDIEIIFDESKCRFIDNFNATTIKDSPIGDGIKAISTVGGTVGGAFAGQAIGGLFGMKGKIIGLASGAALGGVGSYIASANFVKNTKIVPDNTSGTITDLLEDAKPIIAAQLLADNTVTKNTNQNELDMDKISKHYRQELANILTNIICSDENNQWQNIEIRFEKSDEQPIEEGE